LVSVEVECVRNRWQDVFSGISLRINSILFTSAHITRRHLCCFHFDIVSMVSIESMKTRIIFELLAEDTSVHIFVVNLVLERIDMPNFLSRKRTLNISKWMAFECIRL